MVNGRNKGSNNERDVAKTLTKAWGQEFHRTPMSGGLGWGGQNNVSGDIVPPPEIHFPLTLELKKVEESWEFDRMLLSTSLFTSWWNQSCRDGENYNKIPCVIFTKNRRKQWLAMPSEEINKLNKMFSMKMELQIKNMKGLVTIVLLDEFLELVKLTDLKVLNK